MNNWKKRFVIIWTGQLFSILSSNVAQFAIVLWISMKTGSAEVLSFATIAALLPQIVLGPFAGVFVDRWSRKWTMIGADGFVALCSAVMALLFYLDCMNPGYVYLLLMLRSAGSAFHAPAMKSSVPLLAPQQELLRIAGINQMIQSVCMIGGPAIGAVLVVSFDMTVVMLLDVAGAVIACTALLFVTIPDPEKISGKGSARGVLADLSAGFRAIRTDRGVSWLMTTEVLVTFFVMPVVALLPLMTLKVFSGTPYQVSLIEILFGVGTLAGGAWLGVWNPKVGNVPLILSAYAVIGFALLACGLLPPSAFAWYAALTVVQGIALPFYAGPFTALLQQRIEASVMGRVFSLFDSISLLPSIFGLLAAGFFADRVGIAAIFALGGLATALTAVVAFLIPSVRNLEKGSRA